MKMKTILVFLLVLAMIALSACSKVFEQSSTIPESSSTTVIAVVVDRVSDDSNTVHNLTLFNTLDNTHSDLFNVAVPSNIMDKDGTVLAANDIVLGQLVKVAYSGLVQYTYPATYTEVSEIRILGQASHELRTIASERLAALEEQAGLDNMSPSSIPSSDTSPISIALEAPLPISRNLITLSNGVDYYINIEMTGGSYTNFSAGGGSYGNNFIGSYQVRVYTDNMQSVSIDIYTAPISFDGNTTMTFGDDDSLGYFPLVFDDYNHDGNPDFTLGQWGSSNGNIYEIFSIYPDGTVLKLETERLISTNKFDFSIPLEKVTSTSFSIIWYDNNKGLNIKTVYEWQDERFVISSEETA